jgi:predicted RNA-binding protein with TRAM domain
MFEVSTLGVKNVKSVPKIDFLYDIHEISTVYRRVDDMIYLLSDTGAIMFTRKSFFAILMVCLVTLLVVTPILATGVDPIEQRGGGNGGSGNTTSTLLGCQKNNPSRLDCSSLEVSGVCNGAVAVFTIRNTGSPGDGDMRAPTTYRLIVDGVVVQSGTIQLAGGATMQITYSGGGSVTLEADQQIGHPGNSHPRTTLNCAPPPPTEEPTPEVVPPAFNVVPSCELDGSTKFIISNSGGNMTANEPYVVTDVHGNMVSQGTVLLASGESITVIAFGEQLALTIAGQTYYAMTCSVPTEEPTPEVVSPLFSVDPHCTIEGSTVFTIFNEGGDMLTETWYTVTDQYGTVVAEGSLQLASGASFDVFAVGMGLTLSLDGVTYSAPDCVLPTEEPTPEVFPPVFNVVPYCTIEGSTVFTIYNDGGDMTQEAWYTVTDQYGTVVAEGSLMLAGGGSFDVIAFGTGLTLSLDGVTYSASDCVAPTEEVTPTEEVFPPVFSVAPYCAIEGSTVFTIYNDGGDMTQEMAYLVTDQNNNIVVTGSLMLANGGSFDVVAFGTGLTLSLNGVTYSASDCVTPTEEPTPEVFPPVFSVVPYCTIEGSTVFTIYNDGGDMTQEMAYLVTDQNNNIVVTGSLMLASGASLDVIASGTGLTLWLGDATYAAPVCVTPTEEPTPEVTPTEEPTPEPTPEVTPTEEPTPEPTLPPLGCQQNNPDRLDCSSLQVSGTCDANTAVFTITNTGEAGNGDMRAPTAYAIYVDGVLVESGTVDLDGNTSMQVTYIGTGKITLVATQQVGHPGRSQPQASVNCG